MIDEDIKHSTHGGVEVIETPEDFDAYDSGAVRQVAIAADNAGRTRIVFDLTGTRYIDATALGVIVGTVKRARRDPDGYVAVVCTDPRILQTFRTTGLTKVFSVHDTVADALEALTGL
jgi:anti-sigma B factor antagonist